MSLPGHLILFLHLAALAAYLGGWAVFLGAYRTGGSDRVGRGLRFALIGAGIHLSALVLFAVAHRSLPLVGLGPASSTLALAIALLVLAAAVAREEARPVVLFVLPLTMLLLGEAVTVGIDPAVRATAFRGPWFVVHVGTVFVGYAALALASAAAVMYALQFRSLKRKDFGRSFGFLPSLDVLDRMNRAGLAVGFSALTLGLIAGWSWTLTYGRGWDFGNPEVVFGAVTWIVYLGALMARAYRGGRGERAAYATVAAFTVTAGSFLLLRLLGAGGATFL